MVRMNALRCRQDMRRLNSAGARPGARAARVAAPGATRSRRWAKLSSSSSSGSASDSSPASPAGSFSFRVEHQSRRAGSRARVGVISTPHGDVHTPGFVPVATNAAVKCVDTFVVDAHGCELMFCNTYHLMLQPGTEVVKRLGGLHKFMRRKGPLITDSGGFQIFSMAAGAMELDKDVGLKGAGNKKRPSLVLGVDEAGVRFRSYIDGSVVELTPESSVQAQKALGADIIIPLDYLVGYSASPEEALLAFELTHRWQRRSLLEHQRSPQGQAMYAVIHGGLDRQLRQASIDSLVPLGFDGHAVGGSLGKTRDDLIALLDFTLPRLPEDKPNHILGIGDVESVERAVPLGADTFDSSYPTRLARHSKALLRDGLRRDLRRKKGNADDAGPVEPGCECHCCSNYSAAYVHHLVKAKEASAATLLTAHNLSRMNANMADIRHRIMHDEL